MQLLQSDRWWQLSILIIYKIWMNNFQNSESYNVKGWCSALGEDSVAVQNYTDWLLREGKRMELAYMSRTAGAFCRRASSSRQRAHEAFVHKLLMSAEIMRAAAAIHTHQFSIPTFFHYFLPFTCGEFDEKCIIPGWFFNESRALSGSALLSMHIIIICSCWYILNRIVIWASERGTRGEWAMGNALMAKKAEEQFSSLSLWLHVILTHASPLL